MPGELASDAFWAASGAARTLEDEAQLQQAFEAARATYPGLSGAPADFFRYLGSRYPGPDVGEYLDQINVAELYLAWACIWGDRRALSIFDRSYLPEVRAGASRLRCAEDELDDITQEVRRRLLAPRPDGPPRLATLTARGDLRALIRLMALRAGISLRRQHGRELPADDHILEVAGSDGSPAVEFLKQEHRELFGRALERALARLEPRTRSALKLHSIEGVPLAKVATMYRVDRSTVTRWIQRARADILADTRRALIAEGIAPDHFDSFLDVLRSNFEVSLQRLLADD